MRSTHFRNVYLVSSLILFCPITGPSTFHTLSKYLFQIHFNIIHSSTPRFSKRLIPLAAATKNTYAFLFTTIHATHPAHLILLDLVTVTIFDQD